MITRENYEVFYIDFLDGNLSEEMETAFLSFLEANPDLQLEEALPALNPSDESLSAFEKQLLKKEEHKPLIISMETIEYALVAQLEGQLTKDEEKNLQLWLMNHPAYQTEQALYAKTVLAASTISFENKKDLYQHTRIIPLWLSTSAAAASVALIIGISALYSPEKWNVSLPNTPNFSKYSIQKDTNGDEHRTDLKNKQSDTGNNGSQVKHLYRTSKQENAPLAENNFREEKKENKENQQTPNKNITNDRGTLFPNQPEIADRVTEKTEIKQSNDQMGSYVAYGSMSNPIEPITTGLSKQFNTDIDFRRQKETTESDPSGFYLKIGKFEILHKKGGKN
jgi:hypothetical protein